MTSFRRILLGFGMALLLLAIPFAVGAEGKETHRIFFSEDDTARNGEVAKYAMIQLSDLETIAGRQNLDSETIQFLEANLWLPEPIANYASVGIVAHIALCQGEGLLDTGNVAALSDSVESIGLYCTSTARYAAHETDVLLPVGDNPGDQMDSY